MTASASVVEALKPCPFCGDAESVDDIFTRDGRKIVCKCGASVIRFQPNASEKAAKAWNQRATPQPAEQDAREAVALLLRDLERGRDKRGEAHIRTVQALTQAAPDGWRPIETAPCDGSTIIVGRADWDSVCTREWDSNIHRSADLANWTDPPTHWRPAPAPPAQGAG